MPRGKTAEIGDTRVAPNGYHYTRTEGGWVLTHHLAAEKLLGRPLRAEERVKFKSKDKTNFSPSNIEVILKGKSSLRRRKAQLEARIEELQAELKYVNNELQNGSPR
jgi:hypothetical protein